jgi:hypothetical protein
LGVGKSLRCSGAPHASKSLSSLLLLLALAAAPLLLLLSTVPMAALLLLPPLLLALALAAAPLVLPLLLYASAIAIQLSRVDVVNRWPQGSRMRGSAVTPASVRSPKVENMSMSTTCSTHEKNHKADRFCAHVLNIAYTASGRCCTRCCPENTL